MVIIASCLRNFLSEWIAGVGGLIWDIPLDLLGLAGGKEVKRDDRPLVKAIIMTICE